MNITLGIVLGIIWLYMLRILTKAKLFAWKYVWGSCGLFIFMMIYVRPVAMMPLAQVVASIAGILGTFTGCYESYFKYGVIFVDSVQGSISLVIDFECSGILEIMAYLCLLIFYEVYNHYERAMLCIVGTAYIILANALRIAMICFIIYFAGTDAYHIAHTYIGRIFFYVISIILYFMVFTRSHIIRQKIGGFSYGASK